MQICYIDEAGDTGAFDPTNPLSQPVLVLTGVFIRQEQLAQLTRDVMLLKQRFFPNRKNIAPHWHDWLQVEVKGADLRRIIRDGAANDPAERNTTGFPNSRFSATANVTR